MSICDICYNEVDLKKISDRCEHKFCASCNQSCDEFNLLNCPICRKPIYKNSSFFGTNQGLLKLARFINL